MKPDWKDAPNGAKWLAQDSDGSWEWHSSKPVKNPNGPISSKSEFRGYWDHKTMPELWTTAGEDYPNPKWGTTLEKRP